MNFNYKRNNFFHTPPNRYLKQFNIILFYGEENKTITIAYLICANEK